MSCWGQASTRPPCFGWPGGARVRKRELPAPASFAAIPGHGIEATVEGLVVLLGNAKLMRDRKVALGDLEARAQQLADDGKTPMFAAIDGKPAGIVAVTPTATSGS